MEENTDTLIKLTVGNYYIWKSKIENILFYKDLHDFGDNGDVKPGNVR